MVNIRVRDQPKDASSPSPRGEVGEIDTRAPFQSVKAAVSLFGEVAVSKERRTFKKRSSENVLDKETQLLLAQREINKIKQQLDSAETAKARALAELDKAKVTLLDLTKKLTTVRESKQSAIEAAEIVRDQAKELERARSQKAIGFEAWKRELELARKEYQTTVTELDASKKELTKIRQDFDAALEAKLAAFQTAGEAQRSAKLNSEKISELSTQTAAMKASIEELKLASVQAQEEQAKVMAERESQLESYKAAQDEAQMKLISLKKEYDPEQARNLEAKLAETSAEIEVLQEEMKKAHASEMDTVRRLTSELNEASKKLPDIGEEESSLRNLVASLRTELEQVKKEQNKLKADEQAAQALAANLTGELEKIKEQAERMSKELDAYNEQILKVQKLSSETEDARRETVQMSRKAHELRQEAEKSRTAALEAEKKLELVLKEAEEAKAAERRAIEEMKILSEMQGRNSFSNSEVSGKIQLSVEEFERLSGKVKECEILAEKTEAAALAQVEAINTRKKEANIKVEANLKAIEEIKTATEMALRNAETADSAKMAIEGELRRWRQQEHNVAGEASSQILKFSDNSSRAISLRI